MSNKGWVSDHFESLEYSTLSELEIVLKRAREAEAAGLWKDFYVQKVCTDAYSDSEYCYLVGKRPETDRERESRLLQEAAWEKQRAESERQQYEALKKKFENNS